MSCENVTPPAYGQACINLSEQLLGFEQYYILKLVFIIAQPPLHSPGFLINARAFIMAFTGHYFGPFGQADFQSWLKPCQWYDEHPELAEEQLHDY